MDIPNKNQEQDPKELNYIDQLIKNINDVQNVEDNIKLLAALMQQTFYLNNFAMKLIDKDGNITTKPVFKDGKILWGVIEDEKLAYFAEPAHQATFLKAGFNLFLPELLSNLYGREVTVNALVGNPVNRSRIMGIQDWAVDALIYHPGHSIPLGAVKSPKIGTAYYSYTYYCQAAGLLSYGSKQFRDALADVFKRFGFPNLLVARVAKGYILQNCTFAAEVYYSNVEQTFLAPQKNFIRKYTRIDPKDTETPIVNIRSTQVEGPIPSSPIAQPKNAPVEDTILAQLLNQRTLVATFNKLMYCRYVFNCLCTSVCNCVLRCVYRNALYKTKFC